MASRAAAKTACEARGGRLATVDSSDKQTAAASVRTAGWAGWIAGQDVDGTGVWTWDYGHTWDYDHWGPDNPDNPATERCVLLTTNNKWYTRECTQTHAQWGAFCDTTYPSPPPSPPPPSPPP